jgi:hypothetical protein
MTPVQALEHGLVEGLHSHADPFDPVPPEDADVSGGDGFRRAFDGMYSAGGWTQPLKNGSEHIIEKSG